MIIEIQFVVPGFLPMKRWQYECDNFESVKDTCNKFIDAWQGAYPPPVGEQYYVTDAMRPRAIDWLLVDMGRERLIVVEVD